MVRGKRILVIAISAFCLGVLVYVFDRSSEYIYFLPDGLSLNHQTGRIFGSIGNYLPTFVHVYVFILLTAIVVIPAGRKLIPVCLAWLTLDSLFEVAQFNPIAQWIGSHIPTWFEGVPFLENTADYFLMGTFDVFDLISIATGTVAAYLTVSFTLMRTENVTPTQ